MSLNVNYLQNLAPGDVLVREDVVLIRECVRRLAQPTVAYEWVYKNQKKVLHYRPPFAHGRGGEVPNIRQMIYRE